MADPDNSPHLKRVLHSYKSQAMNSLQGPGSQHHLMETGKGFLEDSNAAAYYYNPSKKLNYEEIVRTTVVESCKKCDGAEDMPPYCRRPKRCDAEILWHSSPLPNQQNRGKSPVLPQQSCDNGLLSSSKRDGTIVIVKNDKVADNIIPVTKNNDIYLPDVNENLHQHSVKNEDPPSDSRSNENGDFKWVEPQIFLAPAPFPPQPLPVLASADPGVVPSHRRSETYLDGNPIACFTIGGEPRLCLPQILNTLLISFSVAQINAVCDELQIFCSRCTPRQLEYLKDSEVLPPAATSSGLITKTDAQRLTHALIYSHISRPPPKKLMHAHDKTKQIRVSHNCFGKCKGAIWQEVYNSPTDPCIVCLECNNMFTTMQFVCHAHRAFENRTCHWGFDADNWRYYLMLSKEQVMPIHKAETDFQSFKNKFDINCCSGQKRKQDLDSTEDLIKKGKSEEGFYPNVGGYDTVLANYLTWSPYSPKPPSWAVVPLVTKDGKSLPLPPAVFAKDSIPSTSVPSYLSQGPPVLADPGRVVPMSESEKFERNYQPNVALAPPKMRDKLAREALEAEGVKTEPHFGTVVSSNSPIVYRRYMDLTDKEVKCIKVERNPGMDTEGHMKLQKLDQKQDEKYYYMKMELSSPSSSPLTSPSIPSSTPSRCLLSSVDSSHRSSVKYSRSSYRVPSRGDSVSERPFTDFPPDLVLSTTDSDTESVSSNTSKSEEVEEAEALLRGWTDRAAARKVLDLFANVVKKSAAKDKTVEEMFKQRTRMLKKMELLKGDSQQKHQHMPKEKEFVEKLPLPEVEMPDVKETNGQPPATFPVKQEPYISIKEEKYASTD